VQYDFPESLVVKQQQSCDTQPTEFQYISTSTIEDAHYMPFIIDKKVQLMTTKLHLYRKDQFEKGSKLHTYKITWHQFFPFK
jgi:hypothetical protein